MVVTECVRKVGVCRKSKVVGKEVIILWYQSDGLSHIRFTSHSPVSNQILDLLRFKPL